MAITVFLFRSPGLLNRGPGGPASLGLVPHSNIFSSTATAQSGAWMLTLLGAGFLYRILSSTDWTSCAPSYIIVRRPPSSCGRHKSHSFNPSTVKVIFWYSSTGCTFYLHRCISYFDSPAESEVNIQQIATSWLYTSRNSSTHRLQWCNHTPTWVCEHSMRIQSWMEKYQILRSYRLIETPFPRRAEASNRTLCLPANEMLN